MYDLVGDHGLQNESQFRRVLGMDLPRFHPPRRQAPWRNLHLEVALQVVLDVLQDVQVAACGFRVPGEVHVLEFCVDLDASHGCHAGYGEVGIRRVAVLFGFE